MADITQNVDGFFWLSLATIVFTSVGLIVRYSYKSKCKEVQLCCIKIVRDTEAEEREDMEERKHMPPSPSLQKTSV